MNKQLLTTGKHLINNYDIEGFENLYYDIKESTNSDYEINYQYIFIQLLNHACLKKIRQLLYFN